MRIRASKAEALRRGIRVARMHEHERYVYMLECLNPLLAAPDLEERGVALVKVHERERRFLEGLALEAYWGYFDRRVAA